MLTIYVVLSVRKESLITMGGKHEAKCSRGACDWVVGQVSEVFERTFVLLLAARPHLCRSASLGSGQADDSYSSTQAAYSPNRIFLLTMPLPLGPGQDMFATKLLPHAGRHHPSTRWTERRTSTKWQRKGTSESGEPSIRVRGGIVLDRKSQQQRIKPRAVSTCQLV